MHTEVVTIQDCLDNYEKKGKAAVIAKGEVVKFVKEEL